MATYFDLVEQLWGAVFLLRISSTSPLIKCSDRALWGGWYMLCFLKCTSGTLLSWPKMQRCSPVAFQVVLYGRPLDITSNNGNITSKISVRPAEHLQKELGISDSYFSLWVNWSLEAPTSYWDCKELGSQNGGEQTGTEFHTWLPSACWEGLHFLKLQEAYHKRLYHPERMQAGRSGWK